MSARLVSTVLLCAAPVTAHALIALLALTNGALVLGFAVLGVPAIWLISSLAFLLVLVTFAGGFRHLVSDWLVWPSLILHGAFMILFFAGIYASSGVICVAEICDNDRRIAKSAPYLHGPLGVPLSIDEAPDCFTPQTAIGRQSTGESECIDLDTSIGTGVYFSAVTFSTVGYGDFQPIPRTRLIAALEAVLGFMFFGLLAGAAIDTITRSRPGAPAPDDQSSNDARKVASDMNQTLVALRERLSKEGR